MKAPYLARLTTSPSYSWFNSGSSGSIIAITISLAVSKDSCSVEPKVRIPSSSISTLAPVSSSIFLIFLPLGPITSPILSFGNSIDSNLGALPDNESAGSEMVSSIMSKIWCLASFACSKAFLKISDGKPSIFISNWRAVITPLVPATLKSISPNASSAPKISVSVTNSLFLEIKPIAIPDTCSLIGTPADIKERLDAQTEAWDVDPLDDIASLTTLIV